MQRTWRPTNWIGRRLAVRALTVVVAASSLAALLIPLQAAGKGAPPRPVEYPASWNVITAPSRALPPTYEFGPTTITYKQGTVFPPAAMPLPCDIVRDRDVAVTLRDGTVIYTDVLRPATQSGRLPAIISWSPYGKSIPTAPPNGVPADWVSGLEKFEGADAAVFACNGYAVINPDARGAFKSGGNIHYWGSVEANDGYDVIEWAAKQPWSSGKVALYGSSWLAITQWFIAATRPPHLSAIVPWNGFSDYYRDSLVWGGIPDLAFAGRVTDGLTGEHLTERPDRMAVRDPLMNPYWDDKSAKLERITAPAYVVADGVTSLHPLGALDGFRRVGSRQKWLRINDTYEWYDQYNPANEQDLLRFLDRYLKGSRNGWEKTPRVRVSVIDAGGTDRDESFSQWPVAGTRYQRLYLDATNGSLSPSPGTATATAGYPASTGQATFTITFQQDTQLIGYLKAHLWVEAQGADDMDLFVLAEKLDADGNLLVPRPEFAAKYTPLSPPGAAGRLRVSLRALDPKLSTFFSPVQTFRTPQKLLAGQVVPVDITLIPRAYYFHAGQKLRLTIAGTFVRGTPPVQTLNQGTHLIHTGGQYGSYLQVPVVSPDKQSRH